MGCNTSRPTYDNDGFYSHWETPSLYSRATRATPSHSRNNSDDHSAIRPFLRSNVSDNTPDLSHAAARFFLRRSDSHRYPRIINEKTCSSCGHERQLDKPCFGCLREKPKPRRHRSRRNAQIIVPRASVYGEKKRRLFRTPSIESPLAEEDLPPWVTARHGVFVPKRVANELKDTINQHERRKRHNVAQPNHYTETESDVIGGYVVPPEVYYSRLPLPDLPADAHAKNDRVSANGTKRKGPAWI